MQGPPDVAISGRFLYYNGGIRQSQERLLYAVGDGMRFPAAPCALRLKGKGTFSIGQHRVRSSFTLVHQVHGVWFLTRGMGLSVLLERDGSIRLDGELQDGRPVCCSSMFCTEAQYGSDGSFCILFANGEVELGNRCDGNPSRVVVPLIGHFEGRATLEDDKWAITVTDADAAATKEAARTSRAWELPMTGMYLKLEHPDATLDDFMLEARRVTTLLSLADGTGVTSQQRHISWQGRGDLEVLRHWIGDELGPGPCVAPFDIDRFLAECLPTWHRWPDVKRRMADLAIDYINASARGYVDNRLLGVAQAWEILATAWTPEPEQTTVEQHLLTLVKSVYRRWKRANPGVDQRGVLMDRLAKGLSWSPLLFRMQALADHIDMQRVKLDLRGLKRVRDYVAHNGTIPPDMRVQGHAAVSLLSAARFGLQLVLLSELGYTGRIRTGTPDGAMEYLPIGEFLN
jgi:hypothetical protein